MKRTIGIILGALSALGILLLLIAGAWVVYLFGAFMFGPMEADNLRSQAQASEQRASEASTPADKLVLLHNAVYTYANSTDMEEADARREALRLLSLMLGIRQENQLAPENPRGYLCDMLRNDDFETLSLFIHSGLFNFGATADESGRCISAVLLRQMLYRIDRYRHGEQVDKLKPLVCHLLRQGARTTWPDVDDYFEQTCDDPVLSAVYTRDAEFLRAVLATGCPARGTHGDGRPEAEARWQNSPDLVEILQQHP